jgi:hypothetical protein
VRSDLGGYYRGDHSCGYGSEYIVTVDLAPLVATRRRTQVMLLVIDMLTTLPILVVHLVALLPFLVLDVVMVVLVREHLHIGTGEGNSK